MDDNFWTDNYTIELELVVEEAVVLHQFLNRLLKKKRFRVGDKAEKNALFSLLMTLEGYHMNSWDENLLKAKELMTNRGKSFELGAERSHKLHKPTG